LEKSYSHRVGVARVRTRTRSRMGKVGRGVSSIMLLVDPTHDVAYQRSSSLPKTSILTRRQRVSTDTIVEKRLVVGNKARVTRVQGAKHLAGLVDADVIQSKVAHRVSSADIDKSSSGPAELGDTTSKTTEVRGVGGVEKLQVVTEL
jgi:hypothetical protein